VQQATYESPIAANPLVTSIDAGVSSPPEPELRMTTTSISLPPNYQMPAVAPARVHPTVPTGYTPNLMQQPVNATPMLTSAAPMRPVQQSFMQTTVPAGGVTQAGGYQTASSTAIQSQPPVTSTIAPRTIYSPPIQGFAQPTAAQQSVQTPQVGGALARASAARSLMLNNVVAAQAGAMPQQQMPTPGQPQTITQPASQPLPAATPLTTTISYPQGLPQY
jgi:hypothetical protein